MKESMVLHGKFTCTQIEHYCQKRKGWAVHIIVNGEYYDIYYEKTGHSMLFGFGILCSYIDLEYAFILAWANRNNYKGMFDNV